MTTAASHIAAKATQAGCLADGITEDLGLQLAQLYGLLLNDLGWTPDRFQYWLARSWTRLLLDPP